MSNHIHAICGILIENVVIDFVPYRLKLPRRLLSKGPSKSADFDSDQLFQKRLST